MSPATERFLMRPSGIIIADIRSLFCPEHTLAAEIFSYLSRGLQSKAMFGNIGQGTMTVYKCFLSLLPRRGFQLLERTEKWSCAYSSLPLNKKNNTP